MNNTYSIEEIINNKDDSFTFEMFEVESFYFLDALKRLVTFA